MSRNTVYQDDKISVVTGNDHMLGDFVQVFDKDLETETPEGEGLVLDWSDKFGFEVNCTGISSSIPAEIIAEKYIIEHRNIKSIIDEPNNN